MVDLHQTEPGLPGAHPWLLLSRWGIAWRTTLASAVVGMLGILVLAAMSLGGGNLFIGWLGIGFSALPALIFGALAAILGPWLRRFYPFSQGVIFGIIGAGVIALLLLGAGLVESLRRCLQWEDSCESLSSGYGFAIVMLAGFPLAIMAGAGLGLAIWAAGRVGRSSRTHGDAGRNRPNRRVLPLLFAGTLIVFVSVQAVGMIRPDAVPDPARDGPGEHRLSCSTFDEKGIERRTPCSGPGR